MNNFSDKKQKKQKTARLTATRIISKVDVSRSTLNEKLKRHGFNDDDIQEVLNDFEDMGVVSDKKVAELIVSSAMSRLKGYSWAVFKAKHKGVSKDLIDEACLNVNVDWSEICILAVDKLIDKKRFDRNAIWRKLVNDGFESRMVSDVLSKKQSDNSF